MKLVFWINRAKQEEPRGVKKLSRVEQGFVSIFSVLIIMAVLTLTMIGFSAVVRRAQTSNLNSQLSTQAYYAAESGVNAAISYLETAGVAAADKPNCATGSGGQPVTGKSNLDSTYDVGYTCVLINKSAQDIRLSNVPLQGEAAPKIVNIESSSSASLPALFDIKLGSTTGNSTIATDSTFNAARKSTDIGILRVDMVPMNGLDRTSLANGTYTFFVNFNASGTAGVKQVNPGAASGEVINASCPAAPCTATIKLAVPSAQAYTLRLQSIYSNVSVVIDSVKDQSGTAVTLVNSQSLIDVTGHANSVYRRVQVRLPTASNLTSSFSLQTADSICKRMNVTSTGADDIACGIL